MSYRVVKGEDFSHLLERDVAFLLCIGNTRTAEIQGITVAGESPELIKFTPPADAELLYYGHCKSIPFPPATPDGKPTPALITYTALRLLGTPLFVVDSGLMVKPKIPYYSINAPVGNNIAEGKAMELEAAVEAFEYAKILGREFSKRFEVLMIGESIPAGTTTAGAVLKAMGVEAKVSSSMPENPVEVKRQVIEKAVSRINSSDPLEILAEVGDPVLLAVTGIALGSRKPVILAGGTQMAAASQVIRAIDEAKEIHIATTVYVAEDSTADIAEIAATDVIASDPGLGESVKPGLRAYAEGFVKEGVGAGGATLLAYKNGFTKEMFLKEIEKDYEIIVEQAKK
ncbi:TIGR00303 family protein [Geoglobus ahangari]|uniref:UPF0284 protein GAH_01592 n=1 Tax=Geoglobus ahangari TaxID=113653 RepID=A0A0F7ICX3_9EURY|nr:TIGR00303 family protein [Geoglobus ahangari]AKG91120.1 TIGR00303 family protein [Geoglobus ahangari]